MPCCSDLVKELERRAKISAKLTGKPCKEETKAKLSTSHLGKSNGPMEPETKAKISASKLGKPRSAETRAKISVSKTGKCAGEKHHNYKHGLWHTPEYHAWYDMLGRVYDTEDPRYEDWGGRGITVCDRWKPNWSWVGGKLSSKEAFLNFLQDMGTKPEPKKLYSIDRIDNDENYEPGNCRWATDREQLSNRRKYKKKAA